MRSRRSLKRRCLCGRALEWSRPRREAGVSPSSRLSASASNLPFFPDQFEIPAKITPRTRLPGSTISHTPFPGGSRTAFCAFHRDSPPPFFFVFFFFFFPSASAAARLFNNPLNHKTDGLLLRQPALARIEQHVPRKSSDVSLRARNSAEEFLARYRARCGAPHLSPIKSEFAGR